MCIQNAICVGFITKVRSRQIQAISTWKYFELLLVLRQFTEITENVIYVSDRHGFYAGSMHCKLDTI